MLARDANHLWEKLPKTNKQKGKKSLLEISNQQILNLWGVVWACVVLQSFTGKLPRPVLSLALRFTLLLDLVPTLGKFQKSIHLANNYSLALCTRCWTQFQKLRGEQHRHGSSEFKYPFPFLHMFTYLLIQIQMSWPF